VYSSKRWYSAYVVPEFSRVPNSAFKITERRERTIVIIGPQESAAKASEVYISSEGPSVPFVLNKYR
jgi:hypothetical protein